MNADDTRPAGRLERAYYVVALVVVGRGFFVLLLGTKAGGPALATWGGTAVLALQLTVYLIAVALLVRFLPAVLRTVLRDPLLLFVQAFVGLSLVWSVAPSLTLQALAPFFGASVLAAVLATRLRGRQLIEVVASALAVMICGSLVIVLALPRYGIASGGNQGAWQGAFEQKNMLGMSAALALVTFVFLLSLRSRWRRVWYVVLALAAAVGLVGSTSKTSIVVAALVVLALPILRVLRWRAVDVAAVASGAVVVAIVVGVVVAMQAPALVPELNPRGTLQSRTDLWRMVGEALARRPLLGYGFGAFWQDGKGPDAAILAVFRWGPNHAHNGFLNAALDVGLLGLSLYLVEFANTVLRAGKRLHRGLAASDLWLASFPLLLVGLNVTYSNLLGTSSFFWLLYAAVAYAVRVPHVRDVTDADEAGGPYARAHGPTPS